MSIIAIYNLKGGVGKTSTVVNLAYLAAREGCRTLLWDLDPQGSTTFYYRIKPKVKGGAKKMVQGKRDLDPAIRGTDFANLDLLPSDFSYRQFDLTLDATKKPIRRLGRMLKPLKKAYDHLFLDCPTSLSTLSESVFFAADVLLIPVIPTTLSLRTLDQIRQHLKKRAPKPPRVLPFLCMVDRRKALHKATCAAYADGKEGFLTTVIPFASAVERMGLERAPLPSYDHRSRATRAFEALWDEVKETL
jgi:chromosome partitioning protein